MNLADATKVALQRVGVDVRRHRPVERRRAAVMNELGIRTVLDVGANTGQYATSLRENGYVGGIVSFEPLPDAYAELAAAAAHDDGWTCLPRAVSDHAGTATLHVAGNSASSSLLEMAPAHDAAAPVAAVVGSTEVSLTRLDDVEELASVPDPIMLKLDVQGNEGAALAGAAVLLPRVVLVEAELSVRELYVGAPSMREMLATMAELGFELVALEPGFHDPRDGQILQFDGFFRRPAP